MDSIPIITAIIATLFILSIFPYLLTAVGMGFLLVGIAFLSATGQSIWLLPMSLGILIMFFSYGSFYNYTALETWEVSRQTV